MEHSWQEGVAITLGVNMVMKIILTLQLSFNEFYFRALFQINHDCVQILDKIYLRAIRITYLPLTNMWYIIRRRTVRVPEGKRGAQFFGGQTNEGGHTKEGYFRNFELEEGGPLYLPPTPSFKDRICEILRNKFRLPMEILQEGF